MGEAVVERFTLSGHAGGVKRLRGERGWGDDSLGLPMIRTLKVWDGRSGVGALHAARPCGWGNRLCGERGWGDDRLGFKG